MDEFKIERISAREDLSPKELENLLNRDYNDFDPEDPELPGFTPEFEIKRADFFSLPETGYVIDGMIPEDGITGIFGPPKIGKAFLAMQAAFCVQNGISFLGHRTKRGDVLYVDYDHTAPEIRKKLEMIANYYADVVPDPIMPYILPIDPARSVSLVKVLDTIRMWKWDNPNLKMVVLNNFYSFCDGDPNNEFNAKEKILWLKKLAYDDKIAVLYIHHSNRTASGSLDDVVYGSGGNGIHKKCAESCITLSNGKNVNEPTMAIESRIIQKTQPLVKVNHVFERKRG